ncbi:MAG: CheR family methyltransferase [Massilia sp.]
MPVMPDTGLATEELEIDLLLEALFQRFGFDFRSYERGPLRQKVQQLMRERQLATVSSLQDRVLHEPAASAALLRALSVQPGGLFDDPEQARQLRIVLASCLRASALPKIWLAECASAEEAWSVAILLAEEQLHSRTEIHATVANSDLLAEVDSAGIAPERLPLLEERYRQSGGNGALADYIEIKDGVARLLPQLRARISWAQYNLVTDASFNEFQLIVCQRALPDFGPLLRQRVMRLFHDSLSLFGVIGIDRPIGDSEEASAHYQPVFPGQSWYKRIA